MADNVPITAGSGTSIATEEMGGAHYQKIKLLDGTAGGTGLIPGDATNGLDVDVTRLPRGLIDSFGHLVTAGVNNQVDVQFYRSNGSVGDIVTETNASGGTATAANGMATFSATTTANSQAKGVSTTSTTYIAGSEVYCLFTAAFTGTGSGTSYHRIGLYDANNGFFIGYEAGTFGFTVRKGGSDVQTAKASWSHDPLTGGSTSAFTRNGTPEAVVLTNLNVWKISFGWVGSAPIKLEVLSPDGNWVLCHLVRQPNNAAVPSINTADLPVTCDVNSGNSSAALTILTNCWCAGTTQTARKLTATLNQEDYASLVRAVISGWSTAGGGAFVNVKVTPSGAVSTATDVNSLIPGTTATSLGKAEDAAHSSGDTGVFVLAVANEANTQFAADADYVPIGTNREGSPRVVGSRAHDAVDADGPVKIGGKAIAHGANPTAVSAADRSDFYCNRHGIPFVIGGHMNVVTASARITGSNTDVALSPGTIASGTIIVITRLHVAISNACTVNVGVKVGFGTSTLPADNSTGVAAVIVDNDGFPPGGGVQVGDGSGIIAVGGDGAELRITNDAPTSGAIHVNYSYYTIES